MSRNFEYIYPLIFTFFISCNSNLSDRTDINSSSIDSVRNIQEVEKSGLEIDVTNANKTYKISDKNALEILESCPEIMEIEKESYNDTVTFNDLILVGLPSNTDPRWQYDLGQFQRNIEKYYTLIHFWINANTGKVEVLEPNSGLDNPVDLTNWICNEKK